MTEAAVQERPITSRQIVVGGVPIGGGAQVAVQSMTNTNTSDVEATVRQVYELNAAGADLVRVSVNGSKALKGFKEVLWRSPVPLIADVHFDYRMALGAADAGAACVRVNPGNIGGDGRYRAVIEKCVETGVAMRIGVNSGSVEKQYRDLRKAEALVASALQKVEVAEEMGFTNFKVSLKASHVPEMVQANKEFRRHSNAPLHLGVTEAGTRLPGAIKSAAALGQLLPYGIPDTFGFEPAPPRPERHRLPELRPHVGLRRDRDGRPGRGESQALRGPFHRRRDGLRSQRSRGGPGCRLRRRRRQGRWCDLRQGTPLAQSAPRRDLRRTLRGDTERRLEVAARPILIEVGGLIRGLRLSVLALF